MELTFVQSGQENGKPLYVAEFEVGAEFNLHIERASEGRLRVYQRTSASGKYAPVDSFGYQDNKAVIDYDFSGSIFPKRIRVTSEVQPTLAIVTVVG